MLDSFLHEKYLNVIFFHSGTTTLLAIWNLFQETGIFICRYDFSEPQAGKSVCDRMAATIKGNIKRYVNEGNDCETSLQFVQAAKATSFTTIIAGKIISHNVSQERIQWPGITKFNNISYELKNSPNNYRQLTTTNTILQATVWRAFDIGIGQQYDIDKNFIKIDYIETMNQHIDNRWKSDGLPCRTKSMYKIFFNFDLISEEL